MTTKEFIEKAKKVHNGKYKYDKCEYVNANTKVVITCDKHGDFSQSPYAHLNGQGCPKCAGRGLNRDEVIELFREVHGDKYDYSKMEFSKMSEKVCIICPEHGEFWQTPHRHYKFKQGCPKCGHHKRNEGRKVTVQSFIERANKIFNGYYDYSKVQFTNAKEDDITIICPKHGEFKYKVFWHLAGHGCKHCAVERSRLTKDEFVQRANKIHGNKYDYSNSVIDGIRNEVEISCPKHGVFMQTPESHLKGCGCPRCGREESDAERELYEYVCSLVGKENVIHNDRTVLNGKEIDIYIPLLKLGIEYNGVLWHSEKFGKDRRYHLDKMNECNANGIRLIQIFEDEYMDSKNIVRSKLKRIIGLSDDLERIYARKCIIEEIDKDAAKQFLNANHIQGFVSSSVYLGLKQEGQIVAVMSFTKNSEGHWVLTRYAADNDYIVCGGAGKLFKHFVREYDPVSVKSFADRRWTLNPDNNMYTKIGFKLEDTLPPDYRYIVKSDYHRIHKFNFRKNHLHKRYGFPLTMTESEMTEKIGAYRIYDCGLYRYVWKKR